MPNEPQQLQGTGSNGFDIAPQIVALDGGGYAIAWCGITSDGQSYDVWVQTFSDDGTPLDDPTRLQGMSGNNPDLFPTLAALDGGGFVVAWTGGTSDFQGQDIFAQRFDESGAPEGDQIRLQGVSGLRQDTDPQVVGLEGGGFVLTWSGQTSDGQGTDIFVQGFDADGDPLGPMVRLQGMAGNLADTTPQIVGLEGGGFAVTWTGATSDVQGTDIFVQTFDADGDPVGSPVRLQSVQGLFNDTDPTIAALEGGGFAVAWSGRTPDAQGTDVFVQVFDANGDTDGATQRLQGMAGNLFDETPAIAALEGGGFVVTWTGNTSDGQLSDIFAQRFDEEGNAAGDRIRLQGEEGTHWDSVSKVVALPDGGFAISWVGIGWSDSTWGEGEEYNIFMQRFGPDGSTVGDQQRTQLLDLEVLESWPAIAALSDGTIVMTWSSDDGEGNRSILYQNWPAPAPICFKRGTPILTPEGERSVETIVAGDLVLTRDHGPCRVLWTGSRTIGPRELARRPEQRPIHFPAGAIGNRRALGLSPQHGVLLRLGDGRDWLVRAKHLAEIGFGGARVARSVREVSYHHLLLERHAVLTAAGAATESFYPGATALKAFDAPARRAIAAAILGEGAIAPDLDIAAAYGPRAAPLATRKDLRQIRLAESCSYASGARYRRKSVMVDQAAT